MNCKRLATACLLCVLATPVLADPTLTMMGGRRIWNIAVAPDLVISPGGTPLALELGFRAVGGDILGVSAAQNMPPIATRVEHLNPGEVIFGWETLTDLGDGNMKPVGTQVGTGANANLAVAHLGTGNLTTSNRYDLLTIRTAVSVTALEWGGRYNADGSLAEVGAFVNGRIAQGEGATAVNFNTFAGSLASDAPDACRFVGDMNGDCFVNFSDLAALGWGIVEPFIYLPRYPHLNRIGRADANGDGALNFSDLPGFAQILLGTAPSGAGAGLEASAIPEPSSPVLAFLGMALRPRHRRFARFHRTCA